MYGFTAPDATPPAAARGRAGGDYESSRRFQSRNAPLGEPPSPSSHRLRWFLSDVIDSEQEHPRMSEARCIRIFANGARTSASNAEPCEIRTSVPSELS